MTKPFTGELGSVSPVIIVPGKFTLAEIDFLARHVAAMLVTNAGFNCLATRVIVTSAAWPQRETFLTRLRGVLAQIPLRAAFYPGAHKRHAAFIEAHPKAERFGNPREGELPWTLIAGLDPGEPDEMCFTTEAFCGLFCETALKAASVKEFLPAAVNFANQTLWGTLTSSILLRPADLRDSAIRSSIDLAVAGLRYGTVGVNAWGYLGFALTNTSWGAFPGHDIYDIQSGIGVVNNWLLLDQVQKTVVYGPFHTVVQPSALTPGYGRAMRALARFERDRSARTFTALAFAMCRMDLKHAMLRMLE